jgi:hypothetical protein
MDLFAMGAEALGIALFFAAVIVVTLNPARRSAHFKSGQRM